MARKTILDTYYTFTPSTSTIRIPQAITRERFVLITDVTTNQVLYNFSDPTLKFTSHSISTDAGGNTFTTVVLSYNTASLSSTDKLQIVIDETEETFKPSELYTDPVNKFRVSQPQALIDTDFEYSTQATKWESVGLINNRPFAFYNTNSPITITGINATNGSRTITVLTSSPPAAGTPVFIQDTLFSGADGLYIVDSISAGVSFNYTARSAFVGTSGSIFVSGVTAGYTGTLFSNAAIAFSSIGFSGNLLNVVTSVPHGLAVGNEIAVTGTNQSNANGSWVVSGVGNSSSFSYYSVTAPGGNPTGGNIYTRPQGQFLHRSYDGGVQFSTFTTSHNEQIVRQTRRYFRYQSGKGIQMSTGTILRPNLQTDNLTGSGSTVTVFTKFSQYLSPGVTISVAGCADPAYNGNFTITQVIDRYRFTYTTTTAVTSATAGGIPQVSITSWTGALVRLGMYDSQNGLFFEYDGQQLYAVRRSSTYQIGGYGNVAVGGAVVTGTTINGTTTTFASQLNPNDFVNIKGMTYRVVDVLSNTQFTITPPYRGLISANNAVITKTVDTRIPQSQWNIDRCDGTGPSGYRLDLSRMQMFYIDYSWYGAGFIRWGFRGPTGDIFYAHKLANNNINYEAYMRSGNLPARYEVNTFAKSTILGSTLGSTDNFIGVADYTEFPTSGTLWLHNSTQSEFVTYTGKGATASLSFNLTAGSATATGTNTTGVATGQFVAGNGIPSGTTVQSVVTNTSITLSQPATFTSTQTLNFGPTFTGLTRGSPGATQTVTQTANSAVVTAANTLNVRSGQYVVGTGIPADTFVASVVTNTSITLTEAATSSTTQAMIFGTMGTGGPQTFTYSATAPTAVELHSPSFSPQISHWGSSVIMDGRYDDDKSFVFTQGMTSTLAFTAAGGGRTAALMSFRVAPSVSNGIPGTTLGIREIVNRMQMVLRQIDLFSSGQFLVTLVLNGTPNIATPSWTNVGGSSLAQYINHTGNTTISGGETIYGFYLDTAGGTNFTNTQQELALVRDMGTSILGGGQSAANAGIYPDGPDVVTIVAQNIGTATASCAARLSWTEAQA
jgi:hypothetical protein